MIGDEVPHYPAYTTEQINWFDELTYKMRSPEVVVGVSVGVSNLRAPFRAFKFIPDNVVYCRPFNTAIFNFKAVEVSNIDA